MATKVSAEQVIELVSNGVSLVDRIVGMVRGSEAEDAVQQGEILKKRLDATVAIVGVYELELETLRKDNARLIELVAKLKKEVAGHA